MCDKRRYRANDNYRAIATLSSGRYYVTKNLGVKRDPSTVEGHLSRPWVNPVGELRSQASFDLDNAALCPTDAWLFLDKLEKINDSAPIDVAIPFPCGKTHTLELKGNIEAFARYKQLGDFSSWRVGEERALKGRSLYIAILTGDDDKSADYHWRTVLPRHDFLGKNCVTSLDAKNEFSLTRTIDGFRLEFELPHGMKTWL